MMAKVLYFLLSCLVAGVFSAGCHSKTPDYGPPNNFPILSGNENLKFVSQAKNGKLYSVSVPNGGGNNTSTFWVTHLWGSAYDMGYAQGVLHKTRAPQFVDTVWNYLKSQVTSAIEPVPKWLADLIAEVGLDVALDLTELATKSYTGPHFYEELRGIADGAGVDYQTLVRVHMIGGLTQGHCSMLGAWGDALDKSLSGHLIQLRALDWNMDGPFRDFSALTVYHPKEGNSFVNVGMIGFIGGLTGMSSKQMGISEIGVAFPDSTFGSESRIGIPFIFLLRDILQFDQTVDDAINRMANAKRTCDLILGVGDGKLNEFRGFEYSSSVLNVFDDQNMMPHESWHQRIKNIVYWGMDWICPSYNTVLYNQLKKHYGNLTPEIMIKDVTAVEKSGDNHLAYYDLTSMEMWVSFAAPHGVSGPTPAYARQFAKFNVTSLLAEVPPSNELIQTL